MIKLTTSLGDITIELDTENTPETAKNFLKYVEAGFYNGTVFHRVIDGFMIQGGGLDAQLVQKNTDAPIRNEAKHAQLNTRGTLAMARTGDPHSATAQFFINVADNDFLDFQAENMNGWGYCVFGKVVEGMEVVDAIRQVPTTTKLHYRDVPAEPVLIITAEVVE